MAAPPPSLPSADVADGIKQLLYSVIDSIGKDRIRKDITADTDSAARTYSAEIIDRCAGMLGKSQNDEATMGTLCEALLHFMLTAALLPSERKVTTAAGAELDIVVPSTKVLQKEPSKALVIQVIKGGGEQAAEKIRRAKAAQPAAENIWTISAKPVAAGSRNYTLSGGKYKYSSIIPDIRAFLADKGSTGSLKLIH